MARYGNGIRCGCPCAPPLATVQQSARRVEPELEFGCELVIFPKPRNKLTDICRCLPNSCLISSSKLLEELKTDPIQVGELVDDSKQ